ncbi:hypothetical protein QR680_010975 [Steinernema hermaphroditum]|uniref:Galactosylgalactosylxylosylprotein 3-beta-glucuronosyltransferase n=1 Tax=Steinernema hermaphroditum TaxID=289476 RepID=A0AA39IRW3_9BILA|nr:hypothetical protein QR680_010975 [Steinernema hermaphroditum]
MYVVGIRSLGGKFPIAGFKAIWGTFFNWKIIPIVFFFSYLLLLFRSTLEEQEEKKESLKVHVARLKHMKNVLQEEVRRLEREARRLNETLRPEILFNHGQPILNESDDVPPIFFITPTRYHPAQKADLTRLAQTLKVVPNLIWIVVEDGDRESVRFAAFIQSFGLQYIHLHARTPTNVKTKNAGWKGHRGVVQRNQALFWIRTHFASTTRGVVYFGDDDNTYDWRLFREMRTIEKVGVWPVGIVGMKLVETPVVNENGTIIAFHAWNPRRSFPVDMAAFAINISLLHSYPAAKFSFDVSAGYQESEFLVKLNLTRQDLEPKAANCSEVYVWHTKTQKPSLHASERRKFELQEDLSEIEGRSVL